MNTPPLMLDLANNNTRTGFRLHRLEVLNWGTFHNHIWSLTPEGNNSLLTGDIGSGKSTLVDALTLLLVPHQKITFNKAAGADTKERTISTYIRGDYSTRKGAYDGSSKAVSLRQEGTYSVILGIFYNAGFDQTVTLAQVFWLDNGKENKFFVIAGQELGIKSHFTGFGKDMSQLKKKMKNTPATEVFDTFKDYSLKFRNMFALKSEKALDLFYQTISMKSVSNLNDFVRNQMLEKAEVKEKIDELKRNYDNLTKSYLAIQTAKNQLNQLKPLVTIADQFVKVENTIRDLDACLQALPAYFDQEKASLLMFEITLQKQELANIATQLTTLAEDIDKQRQKEFELKNDIENNAKGKELERIKKLIGETEKARATKWTKAQEYNKLAATLELKAVSGEEAFFESKQAATQLQDTISAGLANLIAERDILNVNLNRQQVILDKEKSELTSLQQRKTQIPEENLKIRSLLLQHTGLAEDDLPFIGELLQVKKEEKEWEGAIERLLHNFGLSVLVPERHYRTISELVDSTNLKGRIVYFRIPQQVKANLSAQIPEDALFEKVAIKNDTPFYDWLENELIEHFNFICCETLEQFHRTPKAITKNGQTKSGKARHEKDDRRNILDRKHYILGWSNAEKIKAIEKEIKGLEKEINDWQKQMQVIQKRQRFLQQQDRDLHDFLKFTHFSDIHWQKEATEIESLKADKEALEKSSDQLKQLEKQLTSVKAQLKQLEGEEKEKVKRQGEIDNRMNAFEESLAECRATEGMLSPEEQKRYFPRLQTYFDRQSANVKTIDKLREEVRKKLSAEKEREDKQHSQLRAAIEKKMLVYKTAYPAETSEADADVKSIPEFRSFLQKIEDEDLPRFEKRFKEELNKGVINDIVLFKAFLEKEEVDIKAKIDKINDSLKSIEYNNGTYIELLRDKAQEKDIIDFQGDLRRCIANTLGESDSYSEEKFDQVKVILDRFNNGNQLDINWTNRVTDVRNWFTFSASEKWAVDGTEKRFYNSSDGGSGGQKEKLAYTILASALAYQFNLEWNQTKSRSFRFAVIDEAFGRGSDESTRYGLELFRKLDLQLLIVTPLQKINIIENYIHACHFVINNENGDNSVVKNLTIDEYRQEKEQYLAQKVEVEE
ncbi:MAG: ATP-binding protein [Bacteroidota bacterium]